MLLMSWVVAVGVGLSDPIQRAHKEKKSRPKPPVLDKGYHGNLSPLGHKISGESTESVCSTCAHVEVQKLLCHRYCLSHAGLAMKWSGDGGGHLF